MTSVTPYNIAVPDEKLQQLRHKLEYTTFPDELEGSGWEMGVPLHEIQRLIAVWHNDFDWRAQERKLNEQLKQVNVRVGVEGFGELDIHAVHHRSGNSKAIPLLFIHGWPGSFLESIKLIPLLTNSGNGPVFDVVAPSLPNFGFSQGVKKRGFGLAQYAEALHKVMIALGYEKYVIQGGDWGSIIARTMSQYYPEHTQAIHLNFIPVMPPYPWRRPYQFLKSLLSVPFSTKDRGYIARTLGYITSGNAYMKQQATRPQTLGYGLHDSPVGLLAWIYDKMHTWSNKYPWTDEEILTWVSIYYFSTAGPMASTRIYYEASAPKGHGSATISEDEALEEPLEKTDLNYMSVEQVLGARAPQNVCFAVAQFHEEIVMWPMAWYRSIGNIVQETEYDRGGHFAAWEVPELLASDIKRFLGNNGPAYGVVVDRDGY
ncbi:Alpha/beta hydrolase fold-1 [Penicillium cf. griseofulvum]|uniref:Alpha/beta hydrolase fold-1 n=1 Tax=Penicillium cf. griseofulvum TaxID=2972120 RepID=A0A9W9M9P9_9EURO|nr:Alpha/beta hydrolase fold-1 [Penicillium cf. griseofulvum]KAJ5445255.1 Alpha/beta hydrolase fold-1 [Penicillium cf. griseofulvum]